MEPLTKSIRLTGLLLLGVSMGTLPGSLPSTTSQETMPAQQTSNAGKVRAPEFPPGLDWLNTDHPLTLKEEKGKVVILDFWTFCCINCIHVIPELKKLERKFARELVVIGVHSAKFTTEQGTENIRQAVLRYDIEHPVVNDRDFTVWNNYAVNAWPTFILIDPDGYIVGRHSGEGVYDVFDGAVEKLVEEFGRDGRLDRSQRVYALERSRSPESLFSFPGKIAADPRGRRLFITDSNHNRVVILSLPDYTVTEVVGSGTAGLQDGSFAEAEFDRPQGICFAGRSLYVADTENHAVRRIDLEAGQVETLAGRSDGFNSPWDLVEHDGMLYVAMAGSHQIWTLDPSTRKARPLAGTGREDIVDGKNSSAALAQPSGIATDGKRLYIADSEVSAVRSVDFSPRGEVHTIVGEGLFDFGDVDGAASTARLQHPIGIAWHGKGLYVADTYNNKIKRIDPATGYTSTVIGDGKEGTRDGEASGARLNEPNGLAVVDGTMYITDTNNHLIRYYSFDRGLVGTVLPRSVRKLVRPAIGPGPYAGTVTRIPPQEVGEGKGSLRITLSLPDGYRWNTMAPFYAGVFPSDTSVASVGEAERNIEDPEFPLDIPMTFRPGATSLLVDLIVYYCEAKSENVCLVKQIRFDVPLKVDGRSGARVVTLGYRLDITSGASPRAAQSPATR